MTRRPARSIVLGLTSVAVAALALAACTSCAPTAARPPEPAVQARATALPWWKGNIHTHSRWSDGIDYPEQVAEWYKAHGYHFLAVTDHGTPQAGWKYAAIAKPADEARLDDYRAWLGRDRPEMRLVEDAKTGQTLPAVRVRALAEYRARFEEPGRFLLIQGEEISDKFGKVNVHVVGVSVTQKIAAAKGASIRETLVNDLARVARQEARLDRPMLAVFAHPNWGGPVPVEDFLDIEGLEFFEVMNEVISNADNAGDAKRLSTDRLWDVMLAARLGRLGLPAVYGVAADDAHDVRRKAGGGWVMVRAADLSPDSLIAAMRAGDFYSSTGVRLRDVRREGADIVVEIDPQAGVSYTTDFLGTIPGYDRRKEDDKDEEGKLLPPTQRYSADIGKVLKSVSGTVARYTPRGSELYVRVRVTSSKPQGTPAKPGCYETAWTQPFVIQPAKP